jgi:hypothetical protein
MSEECSPSISAPVNFEQLAAARREWIESVLRVWCRQATLKELRKAEQEWFDIAGRADVNPTLWTWAWERFQDIVHPELPGVHETFEVRVTLTDGQQIVGYPDGRKSQRGMLVIVGKTEAGELKIHDPTSIDQVAAIERT